MHFKDHFDMQHPPGLPMEQGETNTFCVCNMADAPCTVYEQSQESGVLDPYNPVYLGFANTCTLLCASGPQKV